MRTALRCHRLNLRRVAAATVTPICGLTKRVGRPIVFAAAFASFSRKIHEIHARVQSRSLADSSAEAGPGLLAQQSFVSPKAERPESPGAAIAR